MCSLRSWVQFLIKELDMHLSFISLGAGTAWQVISQGGKARMHLPSLLTGMAVFTGLCVMLFPAMSKDITLAALAVICSCHSILRA